MSKLREASRRLKSEVHVLFIAYSDKRTPLIAKVLAGLTVGYLLSPIDLIPDFIPVLGLLDDLIIVPLLIKLSIRMIPKVVLDDAREFAANHPASMKKTNLVFAAVIIMIWAATVYQAYRLFLR